MKSPTQDHQYENSAISHIAHRKSKDLEQAGQLLSKAYLEICLVIGSNRREETNFRGPVYNNCRVIPDSMGMRTKAMVEETDRQYFKGNDSANGQERVSKIPHTNVTQCNL